MVELFKRPKTISELEDENERKELELSIAQKNALAKRLKERSNGGLTPKSFNFDFGRIIQWLKTH